MRTIPKEWLEFLREHFPVGSRIKIRETVGPHPPMEADEVGTLDQIDDGGHFLVDLKGGARLVLVLGEDSFSVLPPELTQLKLYMPLMATICPYDEWGDLAPSCECQLGGRDLLTYEKEIRYQLEEHRMPEEAERGLMHWYDEVDSLNTKVRSAVFTVEAREGRLWGVAECRVAGSLTPEELEGLKSYLVGQAADGWGEGFEQREIKVDGGELYVHLWQPDNWSIQTEQERFAPKIADGLPEKCFSTLMTTGQLICIKRGDTGYYPSEWDTGDKEQNVELADDLNKKLGVTPAQRQAMEIGSMAGWDAPGADPSQYELQKDEQTGGMSLG